MKETICLAYSGGLDTSVLVKWLQEKYNADLITITLDVGQQIDLKAPKVAGGKKSETVAQVQARLAKSSKGKIHIKQVTPEIEAWAEECGHQLENGVLTKKLEA